MITIWHVCCGIVRKRSIKCIIKHKQIKCFTFSLQTTVQCLLKKGNKIRRQNALSAILLVHIEGYSVSNSLCMICITISLHWLRNDSLLWVASHLFSRLRKTYLMLKPDGTKLTGHKWTERSWRRTCLTDRWWTIPPVRATGQRGATLSVLLWSIIVLHRHGPVAYHLVHVVHRHWWNCLYRNKIYCTAFE